MKISKVLWGLIVLSILGTVLVYPSLPEQVPFHWNSAGEVDKYGDKSRVFILALLPVFLVLLLKYLPKIDPKKESYEKHKKAYQVLIHVLGVFFILVHWVALLVALGSDINVPFLINLGVGILFVIIGNYMGQIRHNYFVGIRTPWTLANEVVWTKTHRRGRWVFIILGVLFIINSFLLPQKLMWLPIGFLIVALLYIMVYSYLEFKKLVQ